MNVDPSGWSRYTRSKITSPRRGILIMLSTGKNVDVTKGLSMEDLEKILADLDATMAIRPPAWRIKKAAQLLWA